MDTGPRQLHRDTLKSQIAGMLAADIEDEVYRPGDRLPSESELTRIHGVSKGTIEGAMELLRLRGLIVTRHGAGSFVPPAVPPPVIVDLDTVNPWDGMTPNSAPRYERGEAKRDIPRLLAISDHDQIAIRHQTATCNYTGKPVISTRIIASLVLEETPGMPEVDTERPDLMRLWKEQYGTLSVAHYIRAVLPPGDKWPALGITEPTAAQEHLWIIETKGGRPLMLEMFLTAGDFRAFIRLEGAR